MTPGIQIELYRGPLDGLVLTVPADCFSIECPSDWRQVATSLTPESVAVTPPAVGVVYELDFEKPVNGRARRRFIPRNTP